MICDRHEGQECSHGEVINGKCVFERKLCVTCFVNENDAVMIRMQTNSLPNHCGQKDADIRKPTIRIHDFETKWNWQVSEQQTTINS